MNGHEKFKVVGMCGKTVQSAVLPVNDERPPFLSMGVLGLIVFGCLFAELIMSHDASFMDLAHLNAHPGGEFIFGTDSLGRDIYSMIWYGGRISLFVGFFSATISTVIAVVYGSVSGLSNEWADDFMMRAVEIAVSIPSILFVILIQALMGEANIVSISVVIGVTSWMNMAKIVRSEVRQVRGIEYILYSKCMGGGFFYILRRHLLPNVVASIMFMIVTNIGVAIGTEATLNFFGIGLPPSIASWGSMLSNADRALLSNYWWIILAPGVFLVTTLICIADVGNYIRKRS